MAQPPRYLVITELFLPTKGGTAVWFDEVYRRIGGKEIHIVTAEVAGAAAHDVHHPNSIHRVSLARHRWLKPESLVMYVKLLWTSLGLGLTHKFDAVHTGRVLPEGLVGLIVARIIRRPLIIYSHGEEITTWRQSAKFRFMRYTYQQADQVIANSEFTRDELIKIGVTSDRITLIYPGVDVHRFRPGLPAEDLRASIGIGRGQKLILSVGRLSRRKGFDQVIRALRTLTDRGLDSHYAIIGIGEDHDYLVNLAAENGVSARVHLLGHVNTEDLPRWYNACDMFAMPNREIAGDTEGFGMVFLEAAACGKPAVAGDAGGTGAAVVHESTGLRINGADTAEVMQALARILGDQDLANRLGNQGRSRAVRDFAWEQVALKTVSIMG